MISKRLIILSYRIRNENLIRIEDKRIRLNFIDDCNRDNTRYYIGEVIFDLS